MHRLTRHVLAAGVAVGLLTLAVPAIAGATTEHVRSHHQFGADHAVFVQTDNTTNNQVVAYERGADGTLTLSNTYDTGGVGGVLNGSAVDHTASQGAVAYDASRGLLLATNAGSNSLSVFGVQGDTLSLRQVTGSNGQFPVSVAVDGDLVYVLNAFDGGSVAGYWIDGAGYLHALQGSYRSLGLTIPTDTSQFTHTPGQVAFSPDGSQLIVTTKANGNFVDVFSVRGDGRLSWSPTANVVAGAVPFAVDFDAHGLLVIAEAGTNSLATFRLHHDGSLTELRTVATNEAATCWVTDAQGYFFASNAGGPAVSAFSDGGHGQLALLSTTATDPGTVDAAASWDGRYLYVQTGKNGIIDEFSVGASGTLTAIGSVTVAGAVGGEGIVAF